MALESDAENQTNITSNEQTPLLADQHSGGQPEPDEVGQEKKQARWYVWRILWAILAVVVLVIFIKGWVDAGGDVDVCSPFYFPPFIPLTITVRPESCTQARTRRWSKWFRCNGSPSSPSHGIPIPFSVLDQTKYPSRFEQS
jgi:hypothetical protein